MGKFHFKKFQLFKKNPATEIISEKKEPEEIEALQSSFKDETINSTVKENEERKIEEKKEALLSELTTPDLEQKEEPNETESENTCKWYPLIEKNLDQTTSEPKDDPQSDLEKIEDSLQEKTDPLPLEKKNDQEETLVFEKTPKKVLTKKEKWSLFSHLAVICFTCLLVILGVFYWISPLNQLQKIDVKGNERISTAFILKNSGLKKGESLWPQVFEKKQVVQKIKTNSPEIKDVTVSFIPLNELKIQVSEYKIDALFKEKDVFYPVLENGHILKTQPLSKREDLPVLVGFHNQGIVKEFLEVYHQLPEKVTHLIEEIHYAGNDTHLKKLSLTMSDGNEVIARLSTLLEYLPKYPQVAAQMKENGVVDMEAGIFSYPYGNEERVRKENQKEAHKDSKTPEEKNVSQNEDATDSRSTFIPDITQIPAQNRNTRR